MSSKSNKVDNLEKQVDAAIEAGLIPSAAPCHWDYQAPLPLQDFVL
jgi:hypothetical protein